MNSFRPRVPLLCVGIILPLLITVRHARIAVVHSASMRPTYVPGDILLVWHRCGTTVCPLERSLQKYDVVILADPDNSRGRLVKRVRASPGERQPIGDLGIDASQPSVRLFLPHCEHGYLKVPPGYVFVMGDSPLASRDSRHFGFIRIDSIIGTVIARLNRRSIHDD